MLPASATVQGIVQSVDDSFQNLGSEATQPDSLPLCRPGLLDKSMEKKQVGLAKVRTPSKKRKQMSQIKTIYNKSHHPPPNAAGLMHAYFNPYLEKQIQNIMGKASKQ